jgi:hypothetical protein
MVVSLGESNKAVPLNLVPPRRKIDWCKSLTDELSVALMETQALLLETQSIISLSTGGD